MVDIVYDGRFKKFISKIKDNLLLGKIKKQIKKIVDNPEIGKPMRNIRKGTREVHVTPFRLSYTYHKNKDVIEFLEIYHKDKQ